MNGSDGFREGSADRASRPGASTLFSVIIANYQNGEYLDAALQSLVHQTYSRWEAIVVDDASTDNSRQVLERWQRDERVTVVQHESRRGTGAAFRSGASVARGEVVGMLGADDGLVPNALEVMAAAHANDAAAGLINSDLIICDAELRPTGEPTPYHALAPGESLIRGCPLSSFATFKRSHYVRTTGFDAALWRAVDHDLYLKLEEVAPLGYVSEALYLYRANPRGVSQGAANGLLAAQSAIIARRNAYRRRKGTLVPNLTGAEYRAMMSTYHRREAGLQRHPHGWRALSHLARALAYSARSAADPPFWRSALHAVAGRRT